MTSDEFLAREIRGRGAYMCWRRADGGGDVRKAGAGLTALATRPGLEREFAARQAPPEDLFTG